MQDYVQYWVEQIALFNDQAAYEKLFLHYNDVLYNFSFSIVKSKQVAEEIVSDTFINLWRNRSRLLEIGNLKVYLYVSVKNLSLKYIDRNKFANDAWIDEVQLDKISATSSSPEELLVSKEMMISVTEAIESLPPKCKLIFKLVREDGLKYKDISRILNISVKTIDAQMAIAAKKITRSLGILQKQ